MSNFSNSPRYSKPSNPVAGGAGGSSRPAYAPRGASVGGDTKSMPTHLLKIKVGEGDEGKFITLTGLFMGNSEKSGEFLKGKTRSIVSIKMDDGTEVSGNQFYIFPKEDKPTT